MFVAGLDLGQSQDYSALALLEVVTATPEPEGAPSQLDPITGRPIRQTAAPLPPHYDLRHLHRWDLQTPYPAIVSDLRELLARPEVGRDVALVVDGTGVGRPVIDYMRKEGLTPIPVSITGGDTVTYEGGWYRVPKRDLVSSLAVAFESDTLRIADGLQYGPVLRKELGNFRAKISLSGHDSYEAWRETDKDDLVLSVALATWWARRQRGPSARPGLPSDRPEAFARGVGRRQYGDAALAPHNGARRTW